MSDFLRATLETNLPKAGKKKSIVLGVSEKNLAGSIRAAFPNLSCETGETNQVVADRTSIEAQKSEFSGGALGS